MKKLKLLGAFVFGSILGFALISGCGHHNKKHKVDVSIIDSSTVPTAPGNITVILQQPQPDETVLNDILVELREFNSYEPEVNITIEIDNDVTVEAEVTVESDRVVVRPGHHRYTPRMYHWLKKFLKKKCNRDHCAEGPKPCDNED